MIEKLSLPPVDIVLVKSLHVTGSLFCKIDLFRVIHVSGIQFIHLILDFERKAC